VALFFSGEQSAEPDPGRTASFAGSAWARSPA
jgi:hypothetical protein